MNKTKQEQLADQALAKMMKENPQSVMMYMLIQMGKMAVEANAGSIELKQCSTFGKQRYEVKAKITVKKVPITTT